MAVFRRFSVLTVERHSRIGKLRPFLSTGHPSYARVQLEPVAIALQDPHSCHLSVCCYAMFSCAAFRVNLVPYELLNEMPQRLS